jgi:hypothetical protein
MVVAGVPVPVISAVVLVALTGALIGALVHVVVVATPLTGANVHRPVGERDCPLLVGLDRSARGGAIRARSELSLEPILKVARRERRNDLWG